MSITLALLRLRQVSGLPRVEHAVRLHALIDALHRVSTWNVSPVPRGVSFAIPADAREDVVTRLAAKLCQQLVGERPAILQALASQPHLASLTEMDEAAILADAARLDEADRVLASSVARAIARTYLDAVRETKGAPRAVMGDAVLTARPTELALPLDELTSDRDWEREQLEGQWTHEHHEAALGLVVSAGSVAVAEARRKALDELFALARGDVTTEMLMYARFRSEDAMFVRRFDWLLDALSDETAKVRDVPYSLHETLNALLDAAQAGDIADVERFVGRLETTSAGYDCALDGVFDWAARFVNGLRDIFDSQQGKRVRNAIQQSHSRVRRDVALGLAAMRARERAAYEQGPSVVAYCRRVQPVERVQVRRDRRETARWWRLA